MKSARQVKGECEKPKAGASSGETAPLFPRLHVNETEKTGPKAPPRNKMALYEQFTIPSHRFAPSFGSSQPAVTPYLQQYVSNDYQYSYISCVPPYANANIGYHRYDHPSFGTSSGGAVVYEDESQRSRSAANLSPCALVSKGTATAVTSSNSRSLSEKKAKDDKGFCVATLREHDNVSGKAAHRMSGNPQKFCVSSTSDVMKSFFGAQTSSNVDSLQERSQNCKTDFEASVFENQSCGFPEGKSADINGKELLSVGDEKQPRQLVQQRACKVLNQRTDNHCTISLGQSGQQHLSNNVPQYGNVCQERPISVYSTAEAGTSSQCKAAGECVSNGRDKLDSVKVISRSLPLKVPASSLDDPETSAPPSKDPETSLPHRDNPELSFPSEEDPDSLQSHRDDAGSNKSQNTCSPTLEENVAADADRSSTEKVSGHESSEEWDNISSGNGEVLEPSQHGTGNGNGSDGSDLPMLDSVSPPSISPKDVIQAVGQYKFWKARGAILRQQQMFSDQVFELHKLIKVQRLLSETPNILIEDLCIGTAAVTTECDDDASHFDDAERQNCTDKEGQNQVSGLNEVEKGQSIGAGAQPGLASCYPSLFQVVKNDINSPMCLGPFPSAPAFIPGGLSAWGYPSLGVGHWMGPMAAQSGAFIHQPFVGHCPTGLAVGGAYGSVALRPGTPAAPPQTVSFSFPGCDQRPELPSETNSRCGPAIASNLQWHSALCHNPFRAPGFLGSWHAMHPSSSVTSNTNQPEVLSHTTKNSSAPGMQFQWDVNCHKVPSDSEGRNRSVCQADKSVAYGFNATLLAHVPFVSVCDRADFSQQDEQGLAQYLHVHGSAKIDYQGDSSSSAGKKDSDGRASVRLKRQEEGSQDFMCSKVSDEQMDVNNLPVTRSVDALTLFPLLPSLRSIDHGRKRPVGETEKRQGQVIKVVPRAAVSASESAAGILLSLQQERQQ